MDTFAALLAMRVKRRFASILKVKDEKWRFIHEAEDLVVFSPHWYKFFGRLGPLQVRIVALGCIVTLVAIGSQVLVNAFADNTGLLTLKVAAYAAEGKMSDGNQVHTGACAVSTAQFPLGTVLALYNPDGTLNRECTAEDTNANITPGQIYLVMPGDPASVDRWAVHSLSAQVLRWGWSEDGPPRPISPVIPRSHHYALPPSHVRA